MSFVENDCSFEESDVSFHSVAEEVKVKKPSEISFKFPNSNQPNISNPPSTKTPDDGIFQKFLKVRSKHTISEQASKELWDFAISSSEEINILKQQTKIPTYSTVKRKAVLNLPRISIKIVYKNLITSEIVTEDNLEKFPRKRLSNVKKYKLLYTMTKINIKEIFSKLKNVHDISNEKIILAIDGVPETKSGGVTIEVIAFKFQNCKTVYPLCILRPEKKYKINVEEYICPLLRKLEKMSAQISFIVADAPKRSFLRKMKAHSGINSSHYVKFCWLCV
jgi:hypothetical protein